MNRAEIFDALAALEADTNRNLGLYAHGPYVRPEPADFPTRIHALLLYCAENNGVDPEVSHALADQALVLYIRWAGARQIADAWDAIKIKWYA